MNEQNESVEHRHHVHDVVVDGARSVPKTTTVTSNSVSLRELLERLSRGLIAAFGAGAFYGAARIEAAGGTKRQELSRKQIRDYLERELGDPEEAARVEEDLTLLRQRGDAEVNCTCPDTCNCNCKCECVCQCDDGCQCKCSCTCTCDCNCECICSCSQHCVCACKPEEGNAATNKNTASVNSYVRTRAPGLNTSISGNSSTNINAKSVDPKTKGLNSGISVNLASENTTTTQTASSSSISSQGSSAVTTAEAAADISTVDSVYTRTPGGSSTVDAGRSFWAALRQLMT